MDITTPEAKPLLNFRVEIYVNKNKVTFVDVKAPDKEIARNMAAIQTITFKINKGYEK